MDDRRAIAELGVDLAQSFLSIVADLREAMYLGELADLPEVATKGETVTLKLPLAKGTWLVVEPVGSGPVTDGSWKQSHRVKLLDIDSGGIS